MMVEKLVPYLSYSPQGSRFAGATISKQLIAVFLVILLLGTANVVIVRAMLSDINGMAETVNMAGKLRMLSQKIAFESAKMVNPDSFAGEALVDRMQDFETTLYTLGHGGVAFGYSIKPLAQRHLPLLAAAQEDWTRYRGTVQALLAKPDRAADPGAQLAQLTQDSERMLADAERLIDSVVVTAQQAQERALMQIYLLLLLNVLVLAAVFVAVRRRIVRPLRELAQRSRELAEGNYHVRIAYRSQDEMGQLAEIFNYSAQQVGNLVARIEKDRLNLKQAESMFRGFAENSVVGVYIAQDGQFRFVNPKMADMFGYAQEEMIASVPVLELATGSDREVVEENIRRRLSGEVDEVHYERRARRKDGSLFDVEVFGSRMQLDGKNATIGIMLDISERKRLDLSLQALSACNQALVRATDEASLLDEICRIVREISGFPFVWVGLADEGKGSKVRAAAFSEADPGALMSLVNHVTWDDSDTGRGVTGTAIRQGRVVVVKDIQSDAVHAPWRDFMVRHGIASAISLPLRAGDRIFGALTAYSKDAAAFGMDEVMVAEELADNLAYGMAALRAESARRQYAQQLEHHASHDLLTGLPNRALLQDRLHQAIAYASRYCYQIWVVFLDLDRFKNVNDSLGHNAGDTLLKVIAARLQAAVRETDTVARLGGDEFVLVLPERMDERLATGIVQRVMDAISSPLMVEGHEFVLGASVGVAVYPNDGEDPETLIRHADLAMYRAKENGRNNFQFYTSAMNDRLLERLRIESDLRNAIERDEFVLHYQPQIDLRTGRTVGVEALIRWQHPVLGMLPPPRFIGLAEETGMIVQIGTWVLRTACAQVRTWQQAGYGELRVAVNLSARQFGQHDLAQSIAAILQETGLAPRHLELELTESLVMSDVERAISMLQELKALGVQISLDDFGTGHSSLSYLKRLPIDVLKIDQSFVRDITHAPDDAAIVASIISLAHNLKRHVIAEGVETQEQLHYLKHHGCNAMQGYYFSKPVPAEVLEKLLEYDYSHAPAWKEPSGGHAG